MTDIIEEVVTRHTSLFGKTALVTGVPSAVQFQIAILTAELMENSTRHAHAPLLSGLRTRWVQSSIMRRLFLHLVFYIIA